MEEKLDFKELERNVIKAKDSDGFIELVIGSFLITFALLFNWDDPDKLISKELRFLISFAPLVTGLYVIYLGRKRITNARIGKFEYKPFSPLLFNLVIIQSIILGVILIINASDNLSDTIKSIALIFYIISLSCLYAYYLKSRKYYLYGIIIALPIIHRGLIQESPEPSILNLIIFLISASIFINVGIIHLKRFMVKYPKQSPEDVDV